MKVCSIFLYHTNGNAQERERQKAIRPKIITPRCTLVAPRGSFLLKSGYADPCRGKKSLILMAFVSLIQQRVTATNGSFPCVLDFALC